MMSSGTAHRGRALLPLDNPPGPRGGDEAKRPAPVLGFGLERLVAADQRNKHMLRHLPNSPRSSSADQLKCSTDHGLLSVGVNTNVDIRQQLL